MAVLLIALLDGTLVDPAQPIVRADDQGVVRGDGVFDALLAVRGRARDLDPHLERLAQSARMLDLPAPDEAGYRRAVDAVLAAWDWAAHPEAVLRMILTRGPEGTAGEPNGWVMAAPLDGILRSITIEELVNGAPAAGLEVRIQELHRDDLGRCRGAWLLSSGRILARVTHVDGQELPSSPLDVRLSRLLGVPWR